MERLLYGVPDVCAALDLKRTTVYELIKDGRIASVKVGKRRLVTADALAKFVADLEAAA